MKEITTPPKTMSSVEIARLTGKRHDNVMNDIRRMIESLDLDAPSFLGTQNYGKNNTREIFNLPKRETLILVSGYSIELRAKIIDRWEYLENQSRKNIQTYREVRGKSKKVRRNFTDTLKDHGCTKQHHFIHITQSQKNILGIKAKKDQMNTKELILVQMAELLSTYRLTNENGYYEVKPVTDSSANNVLAITQEPKAEIG